MSGAILWDFDGTLSYPNKSFFSALHRAAEAYGCIDPAEAIAFLQDAYTWKHAECSYAGQDWWQLMEDKLQFFCAQHHMSPHRDAIYQRFRQSLTDVSNYRLYPDAIATLRRCRQLGFENYIATNNYPEITENIQKLGLMPYIQGCIVSSHLGYEKPRREFYEAALREAPHAFCMIGDNPVADILGAKSMGLLTVSVHACTVSAADHYCKNLADIPPILEAHAG